MSYFGHSQYKTKSGTKSDKYKNVHKIFKQYNQYLSNI